MPGQHHLKYAEQGMVDEERSSCMINAEAQTDCGKKSKQTVKHIPITF
jgi:hypothetical protein